MRTRFILACLALLLGACAPGAPTATPTPAPQVWIEYHIEGGIAGFCDSLTIFSDGTVWVDSCRLDEPRMFTLRDDQKRQLAGWVQRFSSETMEQRDPPDVADGMRVRLVFHGEGRTPADPTTLEALRALADAFVAKAHSPSE